MHGKTSLRVIAAAVTVLLGLAAEMAACAPMPSLSAEATPVHPVVAGEAGPYRHAVLTLSRTAGQPDGTFSGVLDVGSGRRLSLPGPDEPADFFFLEVKAVLFAPVRGLPGNVVVILYDSSQIGPDHGTDHRALVYRVDTTRATRERSMEARLEGVSTAAQARVRLAAGKRR